MEKNKVAASRFIEAFNTDNWDLVREVVSPNFVLHHPIGGTNQLGPEGMIKVWSQFKASLPDSWHPIPIMITEGDFLANLLPTYGNFTGKPHDGVPPTGKWLEYGMVNIVRFEDNKLIEGWFGMDPVAEMQQMGAAPSPPPRQLNTIEKKNVELFYKTTKKNDQEYDNVTAFGDIVVALGPPQYSDLVKLRKLEIYQVDDEVLSLVRSHEFPTVPSYPGDPSVDTELSRKVVLQFFKDVLNEHDLDKLTNIALPEILIHATAMPCEASHYGFTGVGDWLGESWNAFSDLKVIENHNLAKGDIVVVRWTAKGTSQGNFLMLSPTGKTVEFTGISMYRVKSGKVAEIWETRNTFAIMRQLNPNLGGENHHH
jgi:predicted ester cyclase